MEENMIDVNETEKYLPIGTVVLLKGATKRLMIAGYCAVDQEKKDEMWDYSGCMYPEGFLSSTQSFLFDHSQIAKIYSLGYKDNEEEEFQQKLNEYIATKDSGESTDSEDSDEGTDTVSSNVEGDDVVENSESVTEEVDSKEENQLLNDSANVDSTSFDTAINSSVESAPVSNVEIPSVEAPVSNVVEGQNPPAVETVPVTNNAPVVENPVVGNTSDATNPNNAADLSEFDQWLNQTGPYSNNNTNNQ